MKNIYQLLCDSGAALMDFFTLIEMLPNVKIISMVIKKVFLSVSIAKFQIFYRNALIEGIIMKHLNQKSVSVISQV